MGIKDLLNSEKGLLALAVLISATVLTALGKLPIEQWRETALWVLGIHAVGTGVRAIGTGIAARKSPGSTTGSTVSGEITSR